MAGRDLKQKLAEDTGADLLPSVGSVVNERYVIDEILGEGGFAWVFGAHHVELPTLTVAIKVLKPTLSLSKTTVARFRREAEVVASLRGRHLVRLSDFGQTEHGLMYLVMEVVRGKSLYELIRGRRSLSPHDVARIAIQVLKALVEAHELGIVHRDLKPPNIMLVPEPGEVEPIVKVVDFGFAKLLQADGEESARLTTTGGIVCTPHYAAPELLLGTPVPATDLYALGISMIEMLEGRPPYREGTFMAIATEQVSEKPVPLGEPTVASGLADIIARACAKGLEERFESAQEMLGALVGWTQTHEARDTWDTDTVFATVVETESELVLEPTIDSPLGTLVTPDTPRLATALETEAPEPVAVSENHAESRRMSLPVVLTIVMAMGVAGFIGVHKLTSGGESDDVAVEDGARTSAVVEVEPTHEETAADRNTAVASVGRVEEIGEAVRQSRDIVGGTALAATSRFARFDTDIDGTEAFIGEESLGILPIEGEVLPDVRPVEISFRADGHRERILRFDHVGPIVATVSLEPRRRSRDDHDERRNREEEPRDVGPSQIASPPEREAEPEPEEEPRPEPSNPFENIQLMNP